MFRRKATLILYVFLKPTTLLHGTSEELVDCTIRRVFGPPATNRGKDIDSISADELLYKTRNSRGRREGLKRHRDDMES